MREISLYMQSLSAKYNLKEEDRSCGILFYAKMQVSLFSYVMTKFGVVKRR